MAISLIRGTLVACADQRLHGDAGEPQAQHAAGNAQHHAFGHRLPEQPASAGAKSRAHRKFTTT